MTSECFFFILKRAFSSSTHVSMTQLKLRALLICLDLDLIEEKRKQVHGFVAGTVVAVGSTSITIGVSAQICKVTLRKPSIRYFPARVQKIPLSLRVFKRHNSVMKYFEIDLFSSSNSLLRFAKFILALEAWNWCSMIA